MNLTETNSKSGTAEQSNGLLAGLLIIVSATLLWSFHSLPLSNEWIPDTIKRIFGFGDWASSSALLIYFSMAKVLICALPFVFVEFYFDSSKKSRIRELYLFPIFLWIAYFVMSCVVLFIGMKIQRALDITPLFDRLNLSYWSQVAIWIIITDFVIYWYHRLEHTIPFLWTFHSTHHAIEDLNSINQYGHWFEGMVRFFMVTLPVAIFVATPVLDATVIAAIYAVWAVYNHCDRIEARLPKFLTCVFADNVYHRYHHGIEKKYHNSNYANMFSIWDRMFGTQTIPVGNDFPDTGLGYLPPPKNLKEYLAHPFSTKKL